MMGHDCGMSVPGMNPDRYLTTEPLAKQKGTDSPNLRYLAELMRGGNKKTATEAVNALTMLGLISKPLVPDIIEVLKNPVAPRKDIASFLARFGKDASAAVPELNKLLQDKDSSIVAEAIDAISVIGGDESASAVSLLIRALKTQDAQETLGPT